MSEASSRRQEMREARRRQILEAALRVFSRQGYHASNVSDVAAEAGVAQGTIYWYFESKEALFEAALLSFFEGIGAEALSALEDCRTATGKLRALGRSMAGFCRASQGMFMLFLGYWASSADREAASRVWTQLLVEFEDAITAIIEEGSAAGEFRPVDAEPLAWALMAAYDGLAAYVALMPELDLERASAALVETLLSGLAAEGAGGPEASGQV